MAIIFDECHRSQFGENHEAVKGFSFNFSALHKTPMIFEEKCNV